MRFFCFLLFGLFGLMSAFGQPYHPKAGETVFKLSVEGKGDIYIKLYTSEAPKTTAHIEKLIKTNFYDGLRFHRVDKTPKPYLVQIGDPQSKDGNLEDAAMGTKGSGTTVPYEDTGHPNVEGAVGLARSVEDQNSGDSQFYILLGPSKFLDGHYTVFGQVVSGMDIVKKLEKGDKLKSATMLTANSA